MGTRWRFSRLSLQAKLILSYLGVALSAFLLVIVISLVLQNYFYSVQRDELRSQAEYLAQQIGIAYHNGGGNWQNVGPIPSYSADLFIVIDSNQNVLNLPSRGVPRLSQADVPILDSALNQALQGQETSGSLQSSSTAEDGNTFSGLYISIPIYDNGAVSSHTVGALLLAQPDKYPTGFSPKEVLATVNQVLLIVAVVITVIVILFSIFMSRRLTRPLVSLTAAAEKMKGGNYSQRVSTIESQDEIGTLAQTFNAMADKIEADVTELRMQEQLRRDMVANIAHDLITPLTAIQGFSEALADEVISEQNARQETAQLIGREVQRLRRLVSDMQHMTTLESGRMQLDLAPLDMRALVDEVLAVIGAECEQAGITLRNEIAPGTPPVLADSDRITQVLLNLLDNARRYTPAGGSIGINAAVEAGVGGRDKSRPETTLLTPPGVSYVEAGGRDKSRPYMCISVHDTGSGIDPADLPFIFDRFFRIDRARSSSYNGSGLGLSIVKAIITAHGGSVWAKSMPGEGTKIAFTLPIVASISPPVNEKNTRP